VHLSAGVCAQTLLLTVKDNDNMGKNETMGTVSIAVQDIISGGSCTLDLSYTPLTTPT